MGLLDTVMKPRLLPEDVIVQILLFCEIGDILSCGQACRRFASMVETNLYLRYKIELAINGMVDYYGSLFSIGERLAMLRRHREQSYGGPLGYTNTEDQFLWPPEADWKDTRANVSVSGGPSYATIKPLLGVIDIYATPLFSQVDMRHWSVPLHLLISDGTLPEVMNACADTSQDLLLVFVKPIPDARTIFTICIRSLAEPARSHPLAAQSDIVVERDLVYARVSDVQIEGHLLGYAVYDRAWIITVVDWHSGATLWSGTYHNWTTFSLLDSSYILVSRPCEVEVHRFKFPDSGHTPSAAANVPTLETERILTLQFPFGPVDPDIIRRVFIRACSPPLPPPEAPFWPDPDLRVMVMKRYIRAQSREGIMSILPYKDLRRLIELAQSSRADSTTEEVLPWVAWSKYSLNLTCSPSNDLSCSFGSRMPIHVWDENRDLFVVVVDLNPWAARHARKEPAGDAARAQWGENRAALKHFEECYAVASTNGPLYSVCRMPPIRPIDSMPQLVMDHNGYTSVFEPHNFSHPGFQSFFVKV